MKKLLIILLFLSIIQNSYAQSNDSTITPLKNYNNNIQLSAFCVLGIFSAQYERALGKDVSISFIGNYSNPFIKKEGDDITIGTFLATQLRYYLDKNTIKNNGMYTSASYRYVYKRSYNEAFEEYGNYYDTYYKYSSLGIGLGYQTFIKNRIVLDMGASLFYVFSAKVNSPFSEMGWEESSLYNGTIEGGLTLNIGYRF